MPALRQQIDAFFEDLDPDVRQVVSEVLSAEQELIHLKTAYGIMQQVDDILDKVAQRSIEETITNED